MKKLIILVALIGLAAGGYFAFRDGGWLDQVTEDRVRTALLNNNVPEPMADCMAPKLTDRLSINQLRALENIAPEEGESRVPLSLSELTERWERVDDAEAVRVLGESGASCGVELIRSRVEELF